MTPTLPAIERMSDRITRAWSGSGHRWEAFAAIAAEVLADITPPDFNTVAKALNAGLTLPAQRRLDQAFGQPALTLHHDSRFVIEALCWHTGSPAIHQHSFDGAFRVATGRSVHSRYAFDPHGRAGPDVTVGDLTLVDVTLLTEGSTVAIPSGSDLIHSTFHLDNPSMTLIARTHDNGNPEHSYLPPGVAFDPAARSETLHKQLQMLDTLHVANHPAYPDCVMSALDSTSVRDGMEILMRIGNHHLGPDVLDGFLTRYRHRHGTVVAPIMRALTEHRRRSILLSLRQAFTDHDTRQVLACLVNAYDRESFDRQMGATGPNADPRRVASALRALLGLSAQAGPVVDLAVHALTERVPPGRFTAWVNARPNRPTLTGDPALLESFYADLRGHELLTPLLA